MVEGAAMEGLVDEEDHWSYEDAGISFGKTNNNEYRHHPSRLLSISYAHPRSDSLVEYNGGEQQATTNAALAMRRDLDKLVAQMPSEVHF